MTQDPKVQALLKAVDVYTDQQHTDRIGNVSAWETLKAARAAFEPEPELEYVLDEKAPPAFHGFAQSCAHYWANFSTQTPSESAMQGLWNNLRELTRVPKKPKGRELWINLKSGTWFFTRSPHMETRPEIIHVREVLDDKL